MSLPITSREVRKNKIRICFSWMAGITYCHVLRVEPKFMTYKAFTFQRKSGYQPGGEVDLKSQKDPMF